METAPLTLAHSHARTASRETQLSNNAAAIKEHEAAAEQFSTASRGTADSEALRLLKLLEEQHLILARTIKVRSVQPAVTTVNEEDPTALDTPSAAAAAAALDLSSPTRRPGARTTSPNTSRRQGARDLSSSIASNLATARGRPAPQQRRGVPSLPEISTQNAGGRVYKPTERRSSPKSSSGRHSITGEAIAEEGAEHGSARAAESNPSDEGFERFFSTFGSLFSKISPSLAFASLPLSPQPFQNTVERNQTSSKGTPPAHLRSTSRIPPPTNFPNDQEVDLSALISAPALRALRDEAGYPLPHESFYVVPPSGGTESYAGILRQRGLLPDDGPQIPDPVVDASNEEGAAGDALRKQRSSHHSAGSNDEFVDARESFGPSSPQSARNSSVPKGKRPGPRSTLTTFGSKKTGEELEIENAALRQYLDSQSHLLEEQVKRLQMWEASSQNQTAGLMAQSFMISRPTNAGQAGTTVSAARRLPPPIHKASPAPPEGERFSATGPHAEDAVAKIAALEAKLAEEAAARQQLEKSERKMKAENAKLQTVVGKYRERWEVLKQGARERQNKKTAEEGAANASNDSHAESNA